MRFWRRFLVTLLLCLLLAAQPTPAKSVVPWEVTIQSGLDSYHRADYLNAAALWQTALHQNPPGPVKAELHQYLARAQQALGETYRAIEHFDWLIRYYRQQTQRDRSSAPGQQAEVKWGQMQTEQAHNYIQLGHYLKALNLLCGSPKTKPLFHGSNVYPDSGFLESSSAEGIDLPQEADLPQGAGIQPEAGLSLADLSCRPKSAVAIALGQGDPVGLSTALVSLGTIQRLRGKHESATQIFNRALSADVDTTALQRSLIDDGLGAIQAAESARDIRLADFAHLQGEDENREVWLNLAHDKNQAALEFLDRSGEKLTSHDLSDALSDALGESREISWIKNRLNALTMRRRMEATTTTASFAKRFEADLKQLHQSLRALPLSLDKVQSLLRLADLTQDLPERAYGSEQFQFQPILLPPDLLQSANLNLPAFRAEAPGFCPRARPQTQAILQEAWQLSQRLQDHRAQSFIAGRLGHLYECQSNFKAAIQWTQDAQVLASSKEDRFLWDWQAARLWAAQNKGSQALAAYEETLRTLRGIRGELASASYEFQFDFRETIKPIYQELINFRFQFYQAETAPVPSRQTTPAETAPAETPPAETPPAETTPAETAPAETAPAETPPELYPDLLGYPAYRTNQTTPVQHPFNLEDILHSMDELHIFELQNYLGEGCDLPPPRPFTSYDRTTAFISTYIQQDHLAVILSLPQAEQDDEGRYYMRSQLYDLKQDRNELIEQVNRLRQWLGKRSDRTNRWRKDAIDLYNKLIRPLEPALEAAQIDTLVFMHDGILRSLPMAPLHDGEKFLVEHYALAHTPALSLTDPEPTPLDPANHLLAYGLSQAAVVPQVPRSRYFAPLPYVESELQGLQAQLDRVQVRLNNRFNFQQIQQDLAQYSPQILHLATHARFGFDAKQTFLVMGRKPLTSPKQHWKQHWKRSSSPPINEPLTLTRLTELAQARRGLLKLLVLSACETATGSERDILGIAGTAFQTGIWSTLASLWQVDDQATSQLIRQFYQHLNQGDDRAIALQRTQKDWLNQVTNPAYRHPGYWAPFILVGNWL